MNKEELQQFKNMSTQAGGVKPIEQAPSSDDHGFLNQLLTIGDRALLAGVGLQLAGLIPGVGKNQMYLAAMNKAVNPIMHTAYWTPVQHLPAKGILQRLGKFGAEMASYHAGLTPWDVAKDMLESKDKNEMR